MNHTFKKKVKQSHKRWNKSCKKKLEITWKMTYRNKSQVKNKHVIYLKDVNLNVKIIESLVKKKKKKSYQINK